MSPEVLVIGSGEAFDSGLGNTSYLFRGSVSVLFDCGYQIPERLWSRGLHLGLDAVCLTHLHADHSFGIVPLLVRFQEERRKLALHVLGPRGTEAFVHKLLSMGYPGFRLSFPLVFLDLSAARPLVWRRLRFSCARSHHSVLNYAVRVDFKGWSFAVSGDGQVTVATRALVGDVDLLLQEVYTSRPLVPIHADLETVAGFVAGSQLGRVGVSHQERSSKAEVHAAVQRLRKNDRRWFVVKPGMSLSFDRGQ